MMTTPPPTIRLQTTCGRCTKPMEDHDERIACAICKHELHIGCFIEMSKLTPPPASSQSGRTTRQKNNDDSMTSAEKNAIVAALNADTVLVICTACQEKGDVIMMMQKLSQSTTESAIKVNELNEKVASMERSLSQLKQELNQMSPQEEITKDIKELKQKAKAAEEVPARLTMAEALMKNLQTTAITCENEEWKEVKSKSAAKTAASPADIKGQVRDSYKSIKEEELRRRNILIHNVPEPRKGTAEADKIDDCKFFYTEVAATCEVAFTPEDLDDCVRVGKLEESEKSRPILIKFTEQGMRKKKMLFKNLNKFRIHQRSNRGPADANKPLMTVTDDLTDDQREERKLLLAEAKSKNDKLGENSPFLYCVRGPCWKMEIKQIQKKNQQ